VMSEREIQEVLRWLEPNAEPLLIQGTDEEVEVLWESLR